jgi:hypothetical protein
MKTRTLYALRQGDDTTFFDKPPTKFKRQRICGLGVDAKCSCRVIRVPETEGIGEACGLKAYIGFEFPNNRLVKITVSSAKPVRKR